MSVTVVVGAQYGSEGKGNLVRFLANEYQHHVRVGGPNAGHSIQVGGKIWKMQALPCGWANKNATLWLGAGAVISPEILLREIKETDDFGYSTKVRTMIDARATILDPMHHTLEGGIHGSDHARIGSTGEGVGAARISRMKRNKDVSRLARSVGEFTPYLADTVAELNRRHDVGYSIMIEGTQGSALSLIHGDWPYVTTSDPNVSGIMADVGFAPRVDPDVILVARTYPIRVAGNSGPMSNEMSWADLSEKLGKQIEEKTTVTHKTRRVGMWDAALFKRACLLNRPESICLNFVDYLNPEDEGITEWGRLSRSTKDFVHEVERIANAPVAFVGTGGPTWTIIDRR